MKMHVMAIIDPNGGTTLIDQNLAGRTDQLFLNAGQLTFDGNQRLYFTSNGRLRYIDLETREVFSVTSENLTVERYDLVPPSGKIYFRARSWRTNVRALYELMPDLTARPLSTSTNAYSFNQSYLWTGTGLHRDMNTWEDFLFKSSLQLPTINRQATQTDIAGFKVTMTGVKAATITNGIPVNSNLVSFNGRLSFDGSNLFSYEVSGSRLKTVLEKKIKYPPRLLNNSNLGLTVMSAQSPGTANSPVWISISGTSDGLILLRYLDLANAPDQYLVSNSSNADKVLDIDGKLYLYSSSQYFLLEVSGSTATATPVTTPPWSGFDLVHDGKLYDFSGNKVLRFNFTMSRWDELFQIPPPSGCSLTKNSIVAGADGKPLGIVQIDCGTVRNVYAVAYVGWDNLSWETSSKLTNKIWTSNSLITSITHLISRANENMIRIDGNMLVLSAELANPKTIELKSENIEIAGWTDVQLPADFHSTNSLSNTFGPESAIFIESSQSPLRRIFLANLNTGVAREIEPLRGIDLIDSVALSSGEYFLSGEKDGGTSTSAVMVKPDLTWQAVTLPESLDISRWVKRQQ
jgi:hypothetical protein